jgi:hypothetical protein
VLLPAPKIPDRWWLLRPLRDFRPEIDSSIVHSSQPQAPTVPGYYEVQGGGLYALDHGKAFRLLGTEITTSLASTVGREWTQHAGPGQPPFLIYGGGLVFQFVH